MIKWKGPRTETRHKLILTGMSLVFASAFIMVLVYAYFQERIAVNQQIQYYQRAHDSTYTSVFLLTDKVQSVYNQILGDKSISEWTHHRNEIDMYTLRLIQNSFINLVSSHTEIVSLYLHNQNNDLILSTRFRLSEMDDFPDKVVFESYYESGRIFHWTPARAVGDYPFSPQVLSYTAGLPYNGRLGTLSINLNADYIRDNILARNPRAIWLDEQGQPLIPVGNVLAAGEDQAGMLDRLWTMIRDNDNGYFEWNDQHVFVTKHPKQIWQLVTIIPHDVLKQEMNRSYSYVYVIIGLAILFIVMLVWYIRNVYHTPIKQYKMNWEQNLSDLQHEFFVSLLAGKNKPEEIREKAEEYGLDLGSDYQIIVFQIDNYYNYLLNIQGEKRFMMNKVVFNSIIWTFKVRFNVHPIKNDVEKITLLLCRQPHEDNDHEVEEVIRYLQNDIMENCGLTVCVGISPRFEHLEQAPIEYNHAQRALEHKTIYGKQSIIHYEEISAKDGIYDEFPIERIEAVIEQLRRGQLDGIRQELDLIVDEFISKDYISPQLIDAVFANIMAGVTKIIMESRFSVDDLFDEDLFITLYSYDILEDKKDYLLSVCEQVIESTRNKKQVMRNKTSQMILDYIHQNYDKPISLTILADEMNMNPSYLSAFIKNNIGIRFVDYVSQLRVQKAVKLLDNDDLTIQEIAERCGYDTVHSFIRNFKKKYHMPPNEYRLHMRSQKNKA